MFQTSFQCREIVKEYAGKQVLSGVSFSLELHKIYGLIGRNGAGKTTLMSILTAQAPATSGAVTLDGEPVWENQSSLNHICFARELNADQSNSVAAFKLKEYLRIASIYYPAWDAAYAEHLVSLFELDVKKKLHKFSKGMLSMATIVVALASKADITILDEPVAGLDVVAREQFYRLLLEEYDKTERTFVISTHIIEEAAGVFEEVLFLHEGKLLLKENTEELIHSFHYVSGRAEEVDRVTAGLEVFRGETLGRSKGVCTKAPRSVLEGRAAGCEVDIEPLSLQKIFVYLSGGLKEE